jgi:alpha-aminoadipic semialdehyde synthase
MLSPSAYMARLDNDTYNREDYYANPSEYYSTFTEKVCKYTRMSDNMADDQIAPHLTGLINGVGWQSGFPRTMTQRDIDGLLASSNGELRLAALQDVSCDLKVGLQLSR